MAGSAGTVRLGVSIDTPDEGGWSYGAVETTLNSQQAFACEHVGWGKGSESRGVFTDLNLETICTARIENETNCGPSTLYFPRICA